MVQIMRTRKGRVEEPSSEFQRVTVSIRPVDKFQWICVPSAATASAWIVTLPVTELFREILKLDVKLSQ